MQNNLIKNGFKMYNDKFFLLFNFFRLRNIYNKIENIKFLYLLILPTFVILKI